MSGSEKNMSGSGKNNAAKRSQGDGRSHKKRSRKRASKADAVLRATGGTGKDPYSQNNETKDAVKDILAVKGMTTKMNVTATIQSKAIASLAMGLVLKSIRAGWLSSIRQGEQPFYAWSYLIEIFNAALTGNVPLVTAAPRCVWEMCAALLPKEARFKTGNVNYKWQEFVEAFVPSPVYQLRGGEFTYSICWGEESSVTVNDYPVLNTPGAPYTTDLGSLSFASMIAFLGATPMAKISPVISSENLYLGRDTSAFTVVYPEIGVSDGVQGGLATTIYSERLIRSPLLAKFAEYQPSGESYRGWEHAAKSAGSPCYILPRMLDFSSPRDLFNKASPIVKYFNFDEFFYTLSMALAGAVDNYMTNAGNTNVELCPLTSQQVQIIFRQTMISAFCNEYVQDITLGDVFYPMTPFVVGPNGVSLVNSDMLIPTVLAENIRACCRRGLNLGKRNKQNSYYSIDFLPVLARPAGQPQLGNFQVGTITDPSIILLYYPAAVSPVPEVPINLIDLSCSISPLTTVTYLSGNGKKVSDDIAKWNTWISRYSAVLSPLVSLGSEAGISALSTIFATNTQQDNISGYVVIESPVVSPANGTIVSARSLAKQPSSSSLSSVVRRMYVQKNQPGVKRYGTVSITGVGSGPIDACYLTQWTEKEILFNNRISAPSFNFLQDFILPCHLSAGEADQASLQAWQTFQIEPFLVSRTLAGGAGGGGGPSSPLISSRLEKLASYDVKAFTSGDAQNEFVKTLVEAGLKGRGGFFANIAGMLAGAFFPGSEGVVSGLLGDL